VSALLPVLALNVIAESTESYQQQLAYTWAMELRLTGDIVSNELSRNGRGGKGKVVGSSQSDIFDLSSARSEHTVMIIMEGVGKG
jgi:hypothetical protein